MAEAYFEHKYNIRSVLGVLFNSDFFKEARFAKVKSPTELVVGTARLSGGYRAPHMKDGYLNDATGYMGQKLLNPPSVEGWHTGSEWITSGSLVQRVNFATSEFSDAAKPGVRDIIERIKEMGPSLSPEQAADACLDMLGPISDAPAVRGELIAHASTGGDIRFGVGDTESGVCGADKRPVAAGCGQPRIPIRIGLTQIRSPRRFNTGTDKNEKGQVTCSFPLHGDG